MTREKRARARPAGYTAAVALCALFLSSCSPSDPNAGFSVKLKSVDASISAGEGAKALGKLVSLRSSAASAAQWLSIAKRERALGRLDRAEITLRKASRKLPANENLTAVLVDTLTAQKKYPEAAGLSDIIRSTRYTPLAAYAGILGAATFADLGASDPQWWIWAYGATGHPIFSRNAAVMHAASGNFAAACAFSPEVPQSAGSAARSLPDDAYFSALLCHDAQYFDRVFIHLPAGGTAPRSARELSLMADAAIRREDVPLGRLLWSTLALREPGYSPLPLYNLSVTADNAHDGKTELESCLSLFPSYYPAVVRYVRSVPPATRPEPADPVEGELARAGFLTLDAEERLRLSPVDAEVAGAVLERALAVDRELPGGDDMRLRIEAFRFDHARQPDTIRSASRMWELLETTGNDPVVHRYAVWYFASIHNFDSSFTLNGALGDGSIPFYTALEAASAGELERALEEFGKAANGSGDLWQALANVARIRGRLRDYAAAIEDLSVATAMTADDRVKSVLQYETAELLSEMRMPERAASIAGYALELDPSNYRAALLLTEIEAQR